MFTFAACFKCELLAQVFKKDFFLQRAINKTPKCPGIFATQAEMYFLPAKIGTFFPPQMVEPVLHIRTLGGSELVRQPSNISS